MTRKDLQSLAEERLADSQALLSIQRFGAAYYLAGYAVECALKACIAKFTLEGDFPDRDLAVKSYTHDLEKLAEVARLLGEVKRLSRQEELFNSNWATVIEWSEQSRYEFHTKEDAEKLLSAVVDPKHGVLQCIKRFW